MLTFRNDPLYLPEHVMQPFATRFVFKIPPYTPCCPMRYVISRHTKTEQVKTCFFTLDYRQIVRWILFVYNVNSTKSDDNLCSFLHQTTLYVRHNSISQSLCLIKRLLMLLVITAPSKNRDYSYLKFPKDVEWRIRIGNVPYWNWCTHLFQKTSQLKHQVKTEMISCLMLLMYWNLIWFLRNSK